MGDYVVEYHCSQACGQKAEAEEFTVYSAEHDQKLEQWARTVDEQKAQANSDCLSQSVTGQLEKGLQARVGVVLWKRACPKCSQPRAIASLQTKLDFHTEKSRTLVAKILSGENSLKRCMYHSAGRALGEAQTPDIKAVGLMAPYLHEFESVEWDEDIWGFALSDMLGFDYCQTGLKRHDALSSCETATREVLGGRDGTVGFFVTLKAEGFVIEAKKGKLEDLVSLDAFESDFGGHAIYVECVKTGSDVETAVYDNENREDTKQIAMKFSKYSIYICYGEVKPRPLRTKVRAQLLKLATAT